MKNWSKQVFKPQGDLTQLFTVPAGVNKLRVVIQQKRDAALAPFCITGFRSGIVKSWGPAPTGNGTLVQQNSAVGIGLNSGYGYYFKAPFLGVDGTMWNWGNNTLGQIGDGTTTQRSVPVAVPGLTFQKVSRGTVTCFGLTHDGKLYGWGGNADGQLGQGDTVNRSTPTQVMPGTTFVDYWTETTGTSLYRSIFAKDSSGQYWHWGRALFGAAGTGLALGTSTPTALLGAYKFSKITMSANYSHATGLTDEGDLYAWGAGTSGQLGDNTTVDKSSPVAVIGGFKWVDAEAGANHSMGMTRDGSVYTWGANSQGELGQNNILPKSSPTLVSGVGRCRRIYASGQTNYAITETRNVYAWGFQDAISVLLGDGTTTRKSVPTLVSGVPAFQADQFLRPMDGSSVFLFVTGPSIGQIYVWGDNTQGQLGTSTGVGTRVSSALVLSSGFGGANAELPVFRGPESIESEVVVTPGQTLTVGVLRSGLTVFELGIQADHNTDSIEFHWEG